MYMHNWWLNNYISQYIHPYLLSSTITPNYQQLHFIAVDPAQNVPPTCTTSIMYNLHMYTHS